MRLQKYLARSGIASRRGSEELIAQGAVAVNGQIVTAMGVKVVPGIDRVTVCGVEAQLPDENVTFMLHKPAGYVTTMSDPQGRPTAAELVPVDEHPSLYPIGRLDADTTGLLLFSTDGELGHSLLHPRRHVEKRYVASIEDPLTPEEQRLLSEGVDLDDGRTLPARVTMLEGKDAQVAAAVIGKGEGASGAGRNRGKRKAAELAFAEVVLREGRKRQVRRMLEAVGHPVIALHRESFGPLSLDGLERGQCRRLTDAEVQALRDASQ